MIAMIDNYDSFTYNLVQYLKEIGAQIKVFRNDAIDIPGLEALGLSGLVISPGPGRPDAAGDFHRGDPAFYRPHPHSGCLPGASGHRHGLWR